MKIRLQWLFWIFFCKRHGRSTKFTINQQSQSRKILKFSQTWPAHHFIAKFVVWHDCSLQYPRPAADTKIWINKINIATQLFLNFTTLTLSTIQLPSSPASLTREKALRDSSSLSFLSLPRSRRSLYCCSTLRCFTETVNSSARLAWESVSPTSTCEKKKY